MEKHGVNNFIFKNGERFCHVIDKKTGETIYYPNLYLTTHIRNRANSINTMRAVAGVLALLMNYFSLNNIDIDKRILIQEFMKSNEIDSLSDYMSKNSKKGSLRSHPSSVKNPTKYFRLGVVIDYMKWLCQMHLALSDGKKNKDRVDAFIAELNHKRPLGSNVYKKEMPDKSLSRRQLDLLFNIIEPGSELNPFSDLVQPRNRLIIIMLFSFGIRAGEVLNLRVSDIDFINSTIVIKRRPDDNFDPRVNQPLVKTSERIFSVEKDLMSEIYYYITVNRNKINKSKFNDFMFITYKSGNTNGMPLSISAYHKIIKLIRNSHPELSGLCGHQLRHTWNYEFSKKMDGLSEGISQEKEEQIRSYLMGWKEGSGTAKIYNRRHVIEEAHKASLAMQQELIKGLL